VEFRHEMGSFLHEMGSFLEFRIYEPQLFPRPASSRSLRRVGGGRRVLSGQRSLRSLSGRASLRVRRPLLSPCAAACGGGCGAVSAPRGVLFFKVHPPTPPL